MTNSSPDRKSVLTNLRHNISNYLIFDTVRYIKPRRPCTYINGIHHTNGVLIG